MKRTETRAHVLVSDGESINHIRRRIRYKKDKPYILYRDKYYPVEEKGSYYILNLNTQEVYFS